MFCNQCGKQIPDGAKFCGNCGSPVSSQPGQSFSQQPTKEVPFYTAPVNQDVPYTAPVDPSSQYQPNSYHQPNSYQQPPVQQSGFQQPPYQYSQQGTQVQPDDNGKKKKLILGVVGAVVALVLLVGIFGGKDEDAKEKTESKEPTKAVVVEKEETPAPAPTTQAAPKSAADKYPEGELRFDNTAFYMNYEEFVELIEQSFREEDVPFTLADAIPVMEGTKMHYGVRYQGEQVGYMILKEENGRIVEASLTYEVQDDEQIDDYGTDSVLCLLVAGHGNMADHWATMAEQEPLATKDDYILYIYDFDGMYAGMSIYADRIYMHIKIEQ